MPFDAFHRLLQAPGPSMLMIRMGCLMLVKDDTLPLSRILRIVDIPDMPRVPGLNRHVIVSHRDNVKIGLIQPLYVAHMEHPPFPLSRTMPPVLPPQSLPRPQISPRQNTSHTLPQTA